MKYVESLQGDIATIDVVECACGYHMGFDSSYLDQVADIVVLCPSCRNIIDTSVIPEISYADLEV